MTIYLVGYGEHEFKDGDFYLVDAPTREDAIAAFALNIGIREEAWIEWIYERVANDCFAERFWLTNKATPGYDKQIGRYLATPEQFVANVRQFFGPRQDFAQMYLYIWNESDEPTISVEFPTDMQVYMWLNSEWREDSAFDIDSIKHIR